MFKLECFYWHQEESLLVVKTEATYIFYYTISWDLSYFLINVKLGTSSVIALWCQELYKFVCLVFAFLVSQPSLFFAL